MEEREQRFAYNTETRADCRACKWTALLAAAAFSYNIFFFAPVELYLTNAIDFWFRLSELLPLLIVCMLIGFAAVFLLGALAAGRKWSGVFISLVFSALLALYVQGNFLNTGYPEMNGAYIDWKSMYPRGVWNTAFWAAAFLVPLALLIWKRPVWRVVVRFGSALILGIETVTLAVLLLTVKLPDTETVYFNTEEMFHLSQNGNVVVFISDAYDNLYFEWAMEKDPEIAERLDGFVWYDNVSGVSTSTYNCLPLFLTGNLLPEHGDSETGIRECFRESDFYEQLHSVGYEAQVFTQDEFVCAEQTGVIDNLENTALVPRFDTLCKLTKKFYKLTAYRYAPFCLKHYCLLFPEEFTNLRSELDKPAYWMNDEVFYNRLLSEGITATDKPKQYILYHVLGVHPNYMYDTEFERVTYDENTSVKEQKTAQARAQIKLLTEYMDALKRAGIADHTRVIFTADHGWEETVFNPVCLLYTGQDAPFSRSEAPISWVADYRPLIQAFIRAGGGRCRNRSPKRVRMTGSDMCIPMLPTDIMGAISTVRPTASAGGRAIQTLIR